MYLVFNLTKYKELYLLEYNLCNGKKFILHGSCGSGVIGKIEYDTAMCFPSDLWPHSASSWKDRCRSWPDSVT